MRIKLLIALLISASLAGPSCALPIEITRSLAIEALYGSMNMTLLPLNESGQKIYGSSLFAYQTSGDLVFAPGNGINLGVLCSSSIWKSSQSFITAGGLYSSPRLTMTSVWPFVEFPLFSSSWDKPGIIRGFFAEIGPSFNTIMEESKINDLENKKAVKGVSLNVSFGFRALNRTFLSFIARAIASIPVSSDLEKTDTGITVNGAASLSFNAGACISF